MSLAARLSKLAEDPAPDGRTVFHNASAKEPFDGDYIFQVRDGDRFHRFRFLLDRKEMTLKIVAITSLPLML